MNERADYLNALDAATHVVAGLTAVVAELDAKTAAVTDDAVRRKIERVRADSERSRVTALEIVKMLEYRIDPFDEGLTVNPAPPVVINHDGDCDVPEQEW